jgi:hypothetical protein
MHLKDPQKWHSTRLIPLKNDRQAVGTTTRSDDQYSPGALHVWHRQALGKALH